MATITIPAGTKYIMYATFANSGAEHTYYLAQEPNLKENDKLAIFADVQGRAILLNKDYIIELIVVPYNTD